MSHVKMCYQFKKHMNGTHTIGILSLFTTKVESMLCWRSKGLEAHKGRLKTLDPMPHGMWSS